jgi:site-specific recombinase XerD
LIDQNLIEVNGHYELRFAGEELKVRQRRVKGRHRQVRVNRWAFHFPHELENLLQEYLQVWRPKLLRRSPEGSPYLFINGRGKPFDTNHMARVVEETTWRFTQQRPGGPVMVNPHGVRTIWATRMLKAGLNIIDVSRFLGDKIQTVYDKYVTLSDESPPPTPWEIELANKIAQRRD